MLLKNLATLFILTIAILYAQPFIHLGILLWLQVEDWFAGYLNSIFAHSGVGGWLQRILTFLAVPCAVTLVPASLYWCVKRQAPPYMQTGFWLVWTVQATLFCYI